MEEIGMPRVLTLVPRSFGSNTYYVTDGTESFLVDPSVGVEEAKRTLGNDFIPPSAILLTHGHFDHVEALPEWYAAFSPAVYISAEDAPMLSDGYLNAHKIFFGEDKTYFVPHTPISHGCELSLCGERIKVEAYPGHTPGCLVYRLPEMAFVGDLLFAGGGFGRYDLPGGDASALFSSLRLAREKLSSLLLYPGHGEPFNL